MISQRVQEVFLENNGILTSQMIKRAGLNVSSIRKASKRGDIERYSRGIYYLNSLYFDDLYLLQLRYSKGVYSYETAVLLHQMSTNTPFTYHMTFPKGYQLKKAKELNISLHFDSGICDDDITVLKTFDGNEIFVTNKEKTVIDMLGYNNSTPGVVEEMIDNYLDDNNNNLDKLMKYAHDKNKEKILEKRYSLIISREEL